MKRIVRRRSLVPQLLFFVACAGVLAAGVYWRTVIAAYWQEINRVMRPPNVSAILSSLKREPLGILCVGEPAPDDCYLFDKDNIVFDRARVLVRDVIVRVEEITTSKVSIGSLVADGGEWQNLLPIISAIHDGRVVARRIILARAEHEAVVEMEPNGTRLIFSLAFSPREHLAALVQLAKKVKIETLEYLDMRIEGRIFYK